MNELLKYTLLKHLNNRLKEMEPLSLWCHKCNKSRYDCICASIENRRNNFKVVK
jgi:hypothetical protein